MTERFSKAYDALVKAFYEGTLAKGSCAACACGNIINSALGIKIDKGDVTGFGNTSLWEKNTDPSNPKVSWSFKRIFFTDGILRSVPKPKYKNKINKAGYTTEEFCEIEMAFENNTTINGSMYEGFSEKQILEDQYNGLCAVVDVLLKLDNINSEEHYKKKFAEHPELQLI